MECCGCGKEIDINDNNLKDDHAQWFGCYRGNKLLKVICASCIADPIKKQKYVKG